MVSALKHRGPDASGVHEEQYQNQFVFMGHNRLSIIDLSASGTQPMATDDGQIHLIYNGEVYNFIELKNRYLQHRRFKSKTDTEVLLLLYEQRGISFVNELNGDFALAIFDKKRGKFYLIRDRLGVKPLYYAFRDGALLFGSEIKAILAAGGQYPVAEKHIQHYFVFKYVPRHETLFRDIYRVRPGHYVEYDFSSRTVVEREYWRLQKRDEYEKLNYTEAKALLHDLFADAVKIRLISDVPVGNFLSGGMDSSTIALFLKDQPAITHYCAQKDKNDLAREGTADDFHYAAKLARDWNLRLMPISLGGDTLDLDIIRTTLRYSDDLIADGSQIPSFLITRESKKTSTVILSGMGGDEIFLGYAGHFMTLISQYLDKAPSACSHLLSAFFAALWQGKGQFKSFRRYLHKLGKYYRYPHYKYAIYGLVGDFENSRRVCKNIADTDLAMLADYFPPDADPFDCITRFELDNFLVKNLHYMDRMTMANSVEGRVPFLDHRVVELAFSRGRADKLSNTFTAKKILKETFAARLPDYIIKRKKAGFGMPLRSLLSSPGKINELLEKDFLHDLQFFDMDHVKRLIQNHHSGREDNSSIIYALISFQEWYKMSTQFFRPAVLPQSQGENRSAVFPTADKTSALPPVAGDLYPHLVYWTQR